MLAKSFRWLTNKWQALAIRLLKRFSGQKLPKKWDGKIYETSTCRKCRKHWPHPHQEYQGGRRAQAQEDQVFQRPALHQESYHQKSRASLTQEVNLAPKVQAFLQDVLDQANLKENQ